MKWPLHSKPIPDRELPLYNRFYLHAPASGPVDTAIVWGTEIEADALRTFLLERNKQSRIVITSSHALIRATALALAKFPEMNLRVVGRRVFAFRDINVRIAYSHRRYKEIDLLNISQANLKSLEQIASDVWQRLLQAGRGEGGRERDLARMRRMPGFLLRQIMRFYAFLDRHFRLPTVGRLDATRAGCASVNDLSFPGAPPMRSYKPSRFPDDSDALSLTLGPVEQKVIERSGQFVTIGVMPLFLRADHRLADASQVGRFLAYVREILNDPARLDVPPDEKLPGGP